MPTSSGDRTALAALVCLGFVLACTPGDGDEGADSSPESESGTSVGGSGSTESTSTSETGETGTPLDPCEGLEAPDPPLANVGSTGIVDGETIFIHSDHTGAPVVWTWMIQIPLAGNPLVVGNYSLAAEKAECWAGDTDGACDLVCNDTLVVEIVAVTDTCVALHLSQPDPDNLPCTALGDDAMGPFLEIISVEGGVLAERW
jgi:hypothetical protein